MRWPTVMASPRTDSIEDRAEECENKDGSEGDE